MINTVRKRGSMGEIAAIATSFIVLVAAYIWLASSGGGQEPPGIEGSSDSAGPGGTLALYRWLDKSGFDVLRAGSEGDFPPSADTLIMVNPNEDFPKEQVRAVRLWIEQGHDLIIAAGAGQANVIGANGAAHPMLAELGIGLKVTEGYTATLPLAQPLPGAMRVTSVKLPGYFALNLPVAGAVVLVSTYSNGGERIPLAAMLSVGKGRVFVFAEGFPLTNRGIAESDNGAFVYNMVQMGAGRRVAFDEVHHGESSGGDLLGLLTGTPWGWGVLYAAGLTGLYLLWSARRLGLPISVRAPDQRRPTSEYVTAVASLFRRARKPGYAAERYLRYFKRTLTRHAELDPYLTDRGFVEALSERGRYSFDKTDMLRVLLRLRELEGSGEGSGAAENIDTATLKAITEAERLRKQALGLPPE